MSKPNKRIAQRQRTRQAILDTGRRLFATQGYQQTNVGQIAREVGVAHGTVYYHFPDKRTLLMVLLGEFFTQAHVLLGAWADEKDTGDEAARRFSRAVATLLFENREMARILAKESHNPDPQIQAIIRGAFHSMTHHTQRALEAGMDLGTVRPLDARIVAMGHVGMIKEVVLGLLDEEETLDLDHVVSEISDLQNFGIRRMRSARADEG